MTAEKFLTILRNAGGVCSRATNASAPDRGWWRFFEAEAVTQFNEAIENELNWDKAVAEVRSWGMTWIPALLTELIQVGYAKGVFKPGGASIIAREVERRLGKNA